MLFFLSPIVLHHSHVLETKSQSRSIFFTSITLENQFPTPNKTHLSDKIINNSKPYCPNIAPHADKNSHPKNQEKSTKFQLGSVNRSKSNPKNSRKKIPFLFFWLSQPIQSSHKHHQKKLKPKGLLGNYLKNGNWQERKKNGLYSQQNSIKNPSNSEGKKGGWGKEEESESWAIRIRRIMSKSSS